MATRHLASFSFLAAPHGSIYRDLFGPFSLQLIHDTPSISFTITLLIFAA
jgi:hypothetical protein